MPPYHYQRLSAQDNSFLLFEKPGLCMHVSCTQVFELGPLTTEAGGVDFESIKRFIGSVLHRIPRYRQKLRHVPFENTPVWVDDRHFDLDYHVRHTGLPQPGSEAQLEALSARVMAQPLDRARPLWEIWIAEGLDGDRFALISKIHHCMIDGSSGVDISQVLQSVTPDREIPEAPRFVPHRAPSPSELWRDSLTRRLTTPFRAVRGMRAFRQETEDLWGELGTRARAVRDTLVSQTLPGSPTPINGNVGPHRSFSWWNVPLEDLKALRRALGCTLNDVVLTIVTGAFREYLRGRGVDPETLEFRVQAPVSVRSDQERGKLGNRVSAWLLRLPLEFDDPLEQLEAIHETTRELKASRQALGVDLMMSLMEVMPTGLLSLAAQAASGSMNSIVTNVPGPQFPLYLLGARMLAMYPQVPLLQNVGLGIALISYDGSVCWGFNADPALVPDLDRFVADVRASLERVAVAARVKLSTPPATSSRSDAPASADPSAHGMIEP